jgi:hypothetical protein
MYLLTSLVKSPRNKQRHLVKFGFSYYRLFE